MQATFTQVVKITDQLVHLDRLGAVEQGSNAASTAFRKPSYALLHKPVQSLHPTGSHTAIVVIPGHTRQKEYYW